MDEHEFAKAAWLGMFSKEERDRWVRVLEKVSIMPILPSMGVPPPSKPGAFTAKRPPVTLQVYPRQCITQGEAFREGSTFFQQLDDALPEIIRSKFGDNTTTEVFLSFGLGDFTKSELHVHFRVGQDRLCGYKYKDVGLQLSLSATTTVLSFSHIERVRKLLKDNPMVTGCRVVVPVQGANKERGVMWVAVPCSVGASLKEHRGCDLVKWDEPPSSCSKQGKDTKTDEKCLPLHAPSAKDIENLQARAEEMKRRIVSTKAFIPKALVLGFREVYAAAANTSTRPLLVLRPKDVEATFATETPWGKEFVAGRTSGVNYLVVWAPSICDDKEALDELQSNAQAFLDELFDKFVVGGCEMCAFAKYHMPDVAHGCVFLGEQPEEYAEPVAVVAEEEKTKKDKKKKK